MIEEYRTGDLKYTREQAEVWSALAGDRSTLYTKRLAPACAVCAAPEEKLVLLHATLEFLCAHCGSRSSASEIRNGHIVDR